MKFLAMLAAILGMTFGPAMAQAGRFGGCNYCCNSCYNTEVFVPVATAFGVPTYAYPLAGVTPVSYVFAPTAAAPAAASTTTTVSIDAHAIAQEVVAGITPTIKQGIDANHAELMATLAALSGSAPPAPSPTPTPQSVPAPPPAPPLPPAPLKSAEAAPPQSHVALNCAQCHSGPATAGKPSFASMDTLDCTARMRAIRAVLAGRMPKGKKLTSEEAGYVIGELSAQPSPPPPAK